MTSLNTQTPRKEAATPRTADETMCVIGDVTLMDRRLAILIKKPITPYSLLSTHRAIELCLYAPLQQNPTKR